MKKRLAGFLIAVLFSISSFAQVNVTFQVNMEYQTVSDSGVHIAGIFQGWNTSKSPMVKESGSIYSITFSLPSDSTYQYKFLNGTAGTWETVPAACGVTNSLNRAVTVGKNDTVLPPVCFSSCSICPGAPVAGDSVNVTFQVNMKNETVSDSGVHVAGVFQGWNTKSSRMTEEGITSIYTITFKLPKDSTVQFKFLNGNTGTSWETVPKACGITNDLNRYMTIGTKDTTLPAFCFGSCSICTPPPPPPDSVNVTFQVNMEYQTVSDSGVHIAGNFQGWAPNISLMTKVSGTIYSITFKLPEDSTVQFKFLNGPSWPDNETVPKACATTLNRTATIGTKDTTLPAFCFSSCTICTPPPPPPDSVNVTFQVNMKNETVSDSGVHIAGIFQGWNTKSSRMTEEGTTSTYTITFKLPEDSTVQFKFLNGNTGTSWETVPKACGVTNDLNRQLTIGTGDTTLPAFCFSSCTVCPAPPPPGDSVNVTFQVNMQNETVSDSGVHIAGNFQGWAPNISLMTKVSGTIYSVTFKLPEDSTVQFKFLNGPSWPDNETVPLGCATGGNRTATIGTKDTTLPAFCFGSCTICTPPPPPPDSVTVTFQVNMKNETVSDSGVHIAGSFQGWNKTSSQMTEEGNTTIYTITFKLPEDSTYQFKFLNGVSIPDWETVPKACGVTNDLNRQLTIGTKDTTLPAFCFSSCTLCPGPPPPGDSVTVTFQVNMKNETVSDSGVHIAGSFQGWNKTSSQMTEEGTTSIYSITFKLPEDSTYQFKFLNGVSIPDWETVPKACGVTNDLNRQLTIGTRDTTLPAFCFSSCTVCPPPPPPGDSVNVTFQVNMQNETVSDSGVHIAGTFQGWAPNISLMTKVSGSIYAITFRLPEDSTIQFKFLNGNAWGKDETVPLACATGGNRTATIRTNDTTLPAFCFASCTICPAPPPPGDSVNVTFQVNMQNETVSDSGVHIAGSFQGWNTTSAKMTEEGTTTTYTITFKLPEDSTVQFKFLNGNTGTSWETVPKACGITNDLNRYVTIGTRDTTLPPFCFSSCTVCPPPPDSVNVTFQVNMQYQNVSDSGVHIGGSFQGWNKTSSLMTEEGTTTIYSITFKLPEDSTIQFKFLNGVSIPDWEIVPAACGITNDLNRYATIGTSDTTLPAFCFSSCTVCPPLPPPDSSVNVTFQVDMQNQAVSANGVYLAGTFQGWTPGITPMTKGTGSVYSVTISLPKDSTYQYKFINGATWETVPGSCAVNMNRAVSVGTTNITLPVVCFSSCTICAPQNVVNVTFQVDMGSYTVSPKGIHIMGSFQGWDPTASQMINVFGTSIYNITIPLPSTDSVQYKFVNGNVSADAENVPADCAFNGNRLLVVPGNNYTTPLVCFASCSTCILGISNVTDDNVINVYPSPAKDYFTIAIGAYKTYQVNIYDSEGRLVKADVLNKTLNNISLDNFSSGIYTIRMMNNNEVVVKKIMVTK